MNMSAKVWYYAQGSSPVGPMDFHELVRVLPNLDVLVFGPSTGGAWQQAHKLPELVNARAAGQVAPPPPPPRRPADEIDYEIFGEDCQFIEVTLDPNETMIAEAGAMMYMSPAIKMATVFGDPESSGGDLLSKAVKAGSRVLTGESLFVTTYTNTGLGREKIAFAAPYTGKIQAIDLKSIGGELICQKDSFLCAPRGISVDLAFQKNFGAALFGGEGFIMQSIKGDGIAFIHAGGMLVKKSLAAGETLKIDTGCVVGYQPSVQFDIEFMKDIKNALFGNEGFALATLSGPGDIWLQSLPFSRFAAKALRAALHPSSSEEGSILGHLSGTGAGGTLDAAATLGGAIGGLAGLAKLLNK